MTGGAAIQACSEEGTVVTLESGFVDGSCVERERRAKEKKKYFERGVHFSAS
jgi:hypothetical protein